MKINLNENIFCLEERLDLSSAEEIKKVVEESYLKFDEVILDFSKVKFMNSAGLGGIIAIYKMFVENDKSLVLKNMKPHIYSIFEIAGLTKILTIK